MKFLSFITILLSLNVFAADSVRINDPVNLVVTGTTNVNFNLGVDSPSGDATSESAPAKVYLPIQNAVAGQINFSTLKVANGVTSLFDITLTSHFVTFPLLITVGGSKYLYVAVKGGGSGSPFFVSGVSTLNGVPFLYSNEANRLVNFSINPKDICKSVIANNNPAGICSPAAAGAGSLHPTSTAAAAIFKPILYFFLTDQVLNTDSGLTTIDPANANFSGGVYFEAQMSNRIYDSTNPIVVYLNDLRKGDGRLLGTFSTSTTMDSTLFKKVIAYSASAPVMINASIGSVAGSIFANDITTQQSGQFTLNGLQNGTPYNISIALEDKFLFATQLSVSRAGTPTQIQELLKKQACYILTAGFGEEHYITNYFRAYRDHVLANSWLGRKFIRFYYGTAPHYALIIYKSETLRFIVRGFAYTLYFIFNYGLITLIFLVSLHFLNILRKNKTLLKNIRL